MPPRERARQDSNLRPLAPEASALSTELRAPGNRSSRSAGHADRRHIRHPPAAGRAAASGCLRRADREPPTCSSTPATSRPLDVLRELEAIGPPVVGVHGNVDSADAAPAAARGAGGGGRAARGSRWSTTPGPSTGRLERMRRRFGDRADAVVFGHSHMPLHEQAPRRLPDLQPRQPDRAPPRARPHDGPGPRRRRPASRRSSSIDARPTDWRHGPRRPLPRHRRLGAHRRGAGCPPRSCGAAATGCCSTAARAPSASSCARSGWSSSRRSSSPTSTPTTVLGLPGDAEDVRAARSASAPLTVYGPPGLARAVRGAAPDRSAGCRFALELIELEPNDELERDGYRIAAVRGRPRRPRARLRARRGRPRPGASTRAGRASSASRPGPDFGRLQRGRDGRRRVAPSR